mmetsp:Transcript_23880/g.62959  ORF Transcript_23880/g.62959 Transcript_23880/m.62959 type:complete len:301 (-) Transcript_23880:314-1216(-)
MFAEVTTSSYGSLSLSPGQPSRMTNSEFLQRAGKAALAEPSCCLRQIRTTCDIFAKSSGGADTKRWLATSTQTHVTLPQARTRSCKGSTTCCSKTTRRPFTATLVRDSNSGAVEDDAAAPMSKTKFSILATTTITPEARKTSKPAAPPMLVVRARSKKRKASMAPRHCEPGGNHAGGAPMSSSTWAAIGRTSTLGSLAPSGAVAGPTPRVVQLRSMYTVSADAHSCSPTQACCVQCHNLVSPASDSLEADAVDTRTMSPKRAGAAYLADFTPTRLKDRNGGWMPATSPPNIAAARWKYRK